MGYSKITTIDVINFMSIVKARIEFDECGIINLKGYNDSGKSAFLRAISVCLMDKYKSKQSKFIREGEDYFRIVVSFDDGVSILRDKYINGQSLYEMYKDGECIFSTKQGNKLSRIDGVPQPIEEYLGLCVTDSVFLNYQTNEEKLPVVDTTGSENYQMFHEVLRMEEIYRANNMINSDKNELGSEITEIEVDLQRDEVLLSRCSDVTQGLIDKVDLVAKKVSYIEDRNEKLIKISSNIDTIDNVPYIPSIKGVDTERLKGVNSLVDSVKSLENIKVIPNIGRVDDTRFRDLQEILSLGVKLSKSKTIPEIKKVSYSKLKDIGGIIQIVNGLGKLVQLPDVSNLKVASKDKLLVLGDIVSDYKEFAKWKKKCDEIEESLSEEQDSLQCLLEAARERGIELTKCANCGKYTPVGGHEHE